MKALLRQNALPCTKPTSLIKLTFGSFLYLTLKTKKQRKKNVSAGLNVTHHQNDVVFFRRNTGEDETLFRRVDRSTHWRREAPSLSETSSALQGVTEPVYDHPLIGNCLSLFHSPFKVSKGFRKGGTRRCHQRGTSSAPVASFKKHHKLLETEWANCCNCESRMFDGRFEVLSFYSYT